MAEARYRYLDLDGEHELTRAQILELYFAYWSDQMKRAGHEAEISEDRCIDDWIVVNWAEAVTL